MRTNLSRFVMAICVLPATAAFAPRALVSTPLRAQQPLSVLPEHVDALSTAVDQWHLVMASSSSMLADAAAMTADAADVATENSGWWQSYLNIFKVTIEVVHSTIDPPLRSVGITQTWGLSIAVFTTMVRTLLLPLSVQQSKSTEYMKALKPYISEIKEKFKDNQDMKNRYTAKLYEDAKQNPLAGCLVSLAQLPIFLGLYRGVRLLAIDGEIDEPFLWIPSLQGPVQPPDFSGLDWLTAGWTTIDGIPAPSMGWEGTLPYLIMPVLLVVGQALTMQALQPDLSDDDSMSAEEKEQMDNTQGILKFLPLMIGFFSLQVPAGLTIYWFTSNIYTLTQSLMVRQYYVANPPKIELPDYWDALEDSENMSPDERRKAAQAGLQMGPTFEDLKDEAKFHYVVQRGPLRAQSEAWKRVESGSRTIPSEMKAWVASSGAVTTAASESAGAVTTTASESAGAVTIAASESVV